jgi:hypothetical protein
MLTKIQNFSTLELRNMEYLVTLSLLSNSPDSKAISEFSGMIDSLIIISKLNTNIGRHEGLHPLPKDDDI